MADACLMWQPMGMVRAFNNNNNNNNIKNNNNSNNNKFFAL